MSLLPDPNDTEECTICLEPILPTDDIGTIVSCCTTTTNKYYHDKCILQWANNSNSCPTCRRRFYKINIASGALPHKVKRVVSVKDKLLPNDAINSIPRAYVIPATRPVPSLQSTSPEPTPDEDVDFDCVRHSQSITTGFCTICSSSDYRSSIRNMVCCGFCGSNFHLRCLGISSSAHASHMVGWCCPICDSDQDLVVLGSTNATMSLVRNPLTSSRLASGVSRSTRLATSITDSFYRNPNMASITNMDISDMSLHNMPSASNSRLVIHNNNNELDDDFLYHNNDNDSNIVDNSLKPEIHSTVINGGVRLRKEQRAIQNLSPEELQSWELFDEARNSNESTNDTKVSTAISSSVSESKTRRKRKKVTPVAAVENATIHPESRMAIGSSSSRISSLINQLKTTPAMIQQKKVKSGLLLPQLAPPIIPQATSSTAESTVSISPSSNSPMENLSNDSDTQYDSDSKVRKKPRSAELTLDQKIEIQKYIRINLRPLYKPSKDSESSSSPSPVIRTEENYININKVISRRIYGHILSETVDNGELCPNLIDEYFNDDDPTKLKDVIDKYVEEELANLQGSTVRE